MGGFHFFKNETHPLRRNYKLKPMLCGLILYILSRFVSRFPHPRVAQRDRRWPSTGLLEPKRSERVHTSVEECLPERRVQSRGTEAGVEEKSHCLIFAMFVLSQAERQGRAVAGRTWGSLHVQHLRRVLSTDHAKRAREAASSPSLKMGCERVSLLPHQTEPESKGLRDAEQLDRDLLSG